MAPAVVETRGESAYAAFVSSIENAPARVHERLHKWADWALAIHHLQQADLVVAANPAASTWTLRLPPLGERASLVTIWNDHSRPSLAIDARVVARLAPKSRRAVEAAAGRPIGNGTAIHEVTDELLASLGRAYAEAAQRNETERHFAESKSRAVEWLRDERILALDLYVREGASPPRASTQKLSELLRAIPIEQELAASPSFRSRAAVRRKLGNFKALDPDASGGLEHASREDARVWKEFATDPARLRQVAAAIEEVIRAPREIVGAALAGDAEDGLSEAEEGALLTKLHRARERSRRLVQTKKTRALALGPLACEVCSFDFREVYGEVGEAFIECHHTVPVSELAPGAKTHLDDLALVCSNCHRMLHRRRPWLTIAELRSIVASR
jgi:5-methylcytosine-specific restriction protein A